MEEELASIPALILDQFSTRSMTGWIPRGGSDDFKTLTLLRRDGMFYLQVTNNQELVEQIPLHNVITYVIKVRRLYGYHSIVKGACFTTL